MNSNFQHSENEQEKRLDQLLESAIWNDFDDSRLERLETHWRQLMDQDSVEPKESGTGTRNVNWILAVAASLLVGCSVWIALDQPGNNSTTGPAILPGSGDFQVSDIDTGADPSELVVSDVEPIKLSPGIASPVPMTQGDFLAALAKTRHRLAKREAGGRLFSWTGSVTRWIGQSPMLGAMTQTGLYELDHQFHLLRSSGAMSRHQWNEYNRLRRQWEHWAWKQVESVQVESGKSRHSLGSQRFAIAVSTVDSLQRLERLLGQDGLSNDAATGIARMGGSRHIDRALRLIVRDPRQPARRAKRQLLAAQLKQPGRQPALMFLRYMREPATRELAIELANSTDQLPSDVWLESIASHDRWRFDAALAVAQVCDRRVTDGLIYLAANPTTSRTAMMALLKSPCIDARNFVAFAETSQQFSGALSMARKKLKQMEDNNLHREHRNFQHPLLP